MRCKILVIDAYIQHTHDLITLDVGKNLRAVPWDDCEGTAEWDPSLYSVIAPNNPANNKGRHTAALSVSGCHRDGIY